METRSKSSTRGRRFLAQVINLPVRMMEVPVSLMKLPVNLAVSGMNTISDSIHEIQKKSEASVGAEDSGPAGSGPASALRKLSRSAMTPYLEMLKIPRSVLASGVKTFSETMQELRERPGGGGVWEVDQADKRPPQAVQLSTEEAALQSEALLSPEAEALPRTILWQIGRPGRSDFVGGWSEKFDYHVGRDLDAINSPAIPHLLMAEGGPKSAGATERLDIHFTLERDYPDGRLVLIYDRWGAEKNLVKVDGVLLAPVGGAGEGKFKRVELLLRSLPGGDHVLTLTAAGKTESGGHRVDSLMLAELGEAAKP